MSCHNPLHLLCLEAEVRATPTTKTNSILPNTRCPTCLSEILGRNIPLRAVQVFYILSQTLRPIRDTTHGDMQNEWANRPHYRGRNLLINPSCLATAKVTCALCLDDIWPAEEKVVHIDEAKTCRAAFHLDCLDGCRLDAHHCPVCWEQVTGESEAETEEKLAADEAIRRGLRPARSQSSILNSAAMRHNADMMRSKAHPEYYDLHPLIGPAPKRSEMCIICRNPMKLHEATWVHVGQCNNAFHQACLPGWIEYKKQKRQDASDDKKDDWNPDCPTCRQSFMERPLAPTHDAVEFGSAAVETRWDHLPEEVQAEVLCREEEDFDGWPLVIWTDRLRPGQIS